MKGPSSPILLDAWAARSCPVKTQNAYDPTLSEPVGDPRDDELFAELAVWQRIQQGGGIALKLRVTMGSGYFPCY